MKIITISGLDGSGKSTQINLLQDYLTSHGKKVFYFHAIDFSFARKIANLKRFCLICRLLGKCKVKNSDSEKSVTKANKFQIWLRKVFFKIDLGRFKNLVKKLQKNGYDYLISDRYFYDSVVNIDYLTGGDYRYPVSLDGFVEPGRRENKEGAMIRPDVAIYLKTDPKMIMERERVPDQGLEYLEKKKRLYDKYAETWEMKNMDGNRDKEEVFVEIKKYVK